MTLNIAALILAGGASRRMGQDKALLPLPINNNSGLMPLLVHIIRVAGACTNQIYILTPWPERYEHYLSGTDQSIVLLTEKRQDAGPLLALNQGWAMILAHGRQQGKPPPDWLMVLACDLPALDATTLQNWCTHLSHIRAPAIAALPRHNNRWEPLCGFYHRHCLPKLHQAVQQNIRSFQQWLANETVASLSVTDSNMLQNCNTPAQWQQFLAEKESRNP